MKYCVNCGKELVDKSKFCVSCGTEVKNEEIKPVEKKTNGLSITSMVLGICGHVYQFITIVVVMLLIDSIQFFSYFFGNTHHVRMHDRLTFSLMFAGRFCYLTIILSIVGLILGIVGASNKKNKIATAGIVLCSSQIVICLFEILLYTTI